MLNAIDLGSKFWAKATVMACYLKNCSPTSSVKDMTPYEALYGRKLNLSHDAY